MGVPSQGTDALLARREGMSTQKTAAGAQYAKQTSLSPLPQWLVDFGDSRVKRKYREPTQTDEVRCLSLFHCALCSMGIVPCRGCITDGAFAAVYSTVARICISSKRCNKPLKES